MLDVILHLDVHLNSWVATLGGWSYVMLGLVIFCETGLVFTPFLPGDSLLFAAGALCATENAALNILALGLLLTTCAIAGDAVNYTVGRVFGKKLISKDRRFLKRAHVQKAQEFYERHGGKTIVLARFVPIVRTFAPFVAGIAHMNRRTFFIFNVAGGILWVVSLLGTGYALGNIPIIQKNFEIVVLGIVAVSILPVIFTALKERKNKIIPKP